jgi:type II secretory pathway component GspD/PulD (secretin)
LDTVTIKLKRLDANEAMEAVKKRLTGHVYSVTPDPRTNSVTVSADPNVLASVRKLLESLDGGNTDPTTAGLGGAGMMSGPAGGGMPGGPLGAGTGRPAADKKKSQLQTFTLERADPTDVQQVVKSIIRTGDYELVVVPGAKAVMMYADAETLDLAKSIITKLDEMAAKKPAR